LLAGGRLIALDGGANSRGGLAIATAFKDRFPKAAGRSGTGAAKAARALYIAGTSARVRPGGAELVIVQGSYTDEQAAAADILLPETTSFEAAGVTVNVEGRIQVSGAAIGPLGAARPGWSILNLLATKLGTAGFRYGSVEDVRADLVRAVPAFKALGQPGGRSGETFLEEEPGGMESFITVGADRTSKPARGPIVTRDPDIYKGLNLAREHKSLKLVRGR
jgi:NADH dehydrogenase/NADH:ubiquinone oxidoreductase subunit G